MNEFQAELNAELTEENLWQEFEDAMQRGLLDRANEIITKTIKLGFEEAGRKMNQTYQDQV